MADPLAEEAYEWSPYRYGYNNPISFIDPDGMLEDWVEREGEIVWDENITSATDSDLQSGDVYLGKQGYDLENFYHSDGTVTPHSFLIDEVSVEGEMSDHARTMSNPYVKGIHEATGKWGEAISMAMLGEMGGMVLSGAIKGFSSLKIFGNAKNLKNPFKGKTVKQVTKGMEKQVKSGKLEGKYTDPISGSRSYKNKKSGYSYNVDTGKSGKTGKKVEKAHVDVNYPNPKPKNVSKKRKFDKENLT